MSVYGKRYFYQHVVINLFSLENLHDTLTQLIKFCLGK